MKTFSHERNIIREIEAIYKKVPNSFCRKLNLKYIAGFPDMILASPGMTTLFLEVKHVTGHFSEIQRVTLHRMRKAGIEAYGLIAKDSETSWLIDFRPEGCGVWSPSSPLIYNSYERWVKCNKYL